MSELRPLQRVSSLILNSPTRSPSSPGKKRHPTRSRRDLNDSCSEVPDSEVERLRSQEDGKENSINFAEVIEISSDEAEPKSPRRGKGKDKRVNADEDDPFLDTYTLGAGPNERTTKKPEATTTVRKPRRKAQTPRARRIVYTSSSEASDTEPEVITIIDSSPERLPKERTRPKSKSGPKETLPGPSDPTAVSTLLSLYADDEAPWTVDDGSILTLDEPKGARKPIRSPSVSSSPRKPTLPLAVISRPGKEITLLTDPTSVITSSISTGKPAKSSSKARPPSPSISSPSAFTGRRPSKKAQEAERRVRLEAYAVKLFKELNKLVFKDGLPSTTALNWNKRLTSTAGRAKWHRSADGVETAEIELSVKILTGEERIRNTLSHEMCHLAAWIINKETREAHGPIWGGWVAKVMRKRPDINVTTKHNYDIDYKYSWECEQCKKIYGRFSNSINPDRCVCGSCKVGKLIPQFMVRTRKTPRTAVQSRMAVESPQGSPCSVPQPASNDTVSVSTPTRRVPERLVHEIDSSDDDADAVEVEDLTTALGRVLIGGTDTIA